MDIKKTISDAVEKLKNDEGLRAEFMKSPVTALEKVTGKDLPDDQIQGVIDAIKAKLSLDSVGDKIGGLFGKK